MVKRKIKRRRREPPPAEAPQQPPQAEDDRAASPGPTASSSTAVADEPTATPSERVIPKTPRAPKSPRRFEPAPPLPSSAARDRPVLRRRRGLPWTIYRYIGAEILRVMALSLIAISLAGAVVLAYQLARSGIRLGFLWPVLFKSLAYPLFFSLPVSFLFGVTLGFGRLIGDLEVSALRASGVPHRHLALPTLLLAALLSGFAFYLNGQVIPAIHYEKGNLREAILGQLEALGSGSNRSLLLPRGGQLFVEGYNGTRLRGVHLEINEAVSRRLSKKLRRRLREVEGRTRRSGPRVRARPTLLAKECDLSISVDRTEILLSLRGVTINVPQAATGAKRRPDVFRQTISIGALKLALPFLPRGERVKDHSWKQLLVEERGLSEEIEAAQDELMAARATNAGDDQNDEDGDEAETRALERDLRYLERKSLEARTEFHRRIALSLACLSLALVALPMILLTGHRSRLVPFFFGNVFVVLPFFLLVMLGVKLGESGISPAVMLAAPNGLLIVIALFLWPRVLRQ